MPADDPVEFPADTVWFVALDAQGAVVGYAGVRFHSRKKVAEHLLAGVHHSQRGKGLQRSLLAARERAARRAGMIRAVTYTRPENAPSAKNLAKARYSTYRPAKAWGGRSMVYWEKRL